MSHTAIRDAQATSVEQTTLAQNTPTQSRVERNTPGLRAPRQGTLKQDALSHCTPELDVSGQSMAEKNTPEQSMAGQGALNQSAQQNQEEQLPGAPSLLSEYPEVAVFQAMAAYDNLGRRIIMERRQEMTKSQIEAIMSVHLFGSLTMTQISNHLAVSNEQASRAIGPLVERGLMQRTRRPDNQRIVEVSLTNAGRKFVFESWNEVLTALNSRLQVLPARERKRLIKASQEAVEILMRLLQISR